MALAWASIEKAIRDWLVASTGLSAVVFAHQKAPILAEPFITITISGPRVTGNALDEFYTTTNLSNPTGQEVEQNIIGRREITVSVQAFTANTVGSNTAKEYLGKAILALGFPSNQDLLGVAGLALMNASDIQDLTAILDTRWQGRAAVDILFHCVDTAVEKTGYIATVEATGTVS